MDKAELKNKIRLKIHDFKNRKAKAKDVFVLKPISQKWAHRFVSKYHYLGNARFLSMYNHGIFIENMLVGCATYGSPQGTMTLKGWFGLENSDTTVMELTRLCVVPVLNGSNATSFLLGNSIKKLKKEGIRAVITLADDSMHIGSIYQVCNFIYYGLSDPKSDFYNTEGMVNPRGETKQANGVWLPRTRKHRYAYIIDKKLKVLLKEEHKPSTDTKTIYSCCGGSKVVVDKRFNVEYTCPKCTGKLKPLSYEKSVGYRRLFSEAS